MNFVGAGVSPGEILRRWKARFLNYRPEGSNLYGARPRIEEGEAAVIYLVGPLMEMRETG